MLNDLSELLPVEIYSDLVEKKTKSIADIYLKKQ